MEHQRGNAQCGNRGDDCPGKPYGRLSISKLILPPHQRQDEIAVRPHSTKHALYPFPIELGAQSTRSLAVVRMGMELDTPPVSCPQVPRSECRSNQRTP